jgi:hypothetical protein
MHDVKKINIQDQDFAMALKFFTGLCFITKIKSYGKKSILNVTITRKFIPSHKLKTK